MSRQFAKLLAPLVRRIRQIATRAIVELIDTDTALTTLKIKISENESLEDIEHFEPYGFTANPPAGSEALVISVGGRREHSVVLQVASRKYRLVGLKPGDVALYNMNGDKIVMAANGETTLKVATKVIMECPNFEITGDLKLNGNMNLQGDLATSGKHDIGGDVEVGGSQVTVGDVVGAGVSLKGHVHGGVKSGGGSTTPPG